MLHRPKRTAIGFGLLCLLALPGAAVAEDPFVNTPPPPGAVCPSIAQNYALCQADPMSGNCRDFVTAAHELGRLYLFNVQRQPNRAEEMKTTIWWQCGSATFADLKALLERIDSPAARTVLTEAPYRSLPTPHDQASALHEESLGGEGPLHGGPRSGMLPAHWTPPQGTSQPVPFSFESQGNDTTQGTMHTTLGPGGERFEGNYLRFQQSTKGELVTAMSVGWSGPEWQLWKHDSDGGWTEEGVSVGEFAHFYNGKVIATLKGNRGHAMRCQFVLKDPDAGLLEGGTGRCQVTDGGSLGLEF